MEYKIKELMDWWQQFKNEEIVVGTDNHKFEITVNQNQLPHLLGLQYVNASKTNGMSGRRLFEYCYFRSDEEIFDLVRTNHLSMLQSVYDRVTTFRYFMEHLENGILVENTKESSNIKSQHFIVEYNDEKILHLGLLEVAGEDVLVDFNVMDKKLETYFLTNSNKYFNRSVITEKIKSIEKYNDQGELEPFSFCMNHDENDITMDEMEMEAEYVDYGMEM